jgi:ribosomal 30S subunit maturation factor RimM
MMKVSELIKELQKIDPDLEVQNFHKDFYYSAIVGVEVVETNHGKVCLVI